MKMRKMIWAVCLIALMPISAGAFGVMLYEEPQQKENTQEKEIPNPEKAARKRTDEMDKVLNLTEKQYKKIYKLNLKEEREKLEAMIGSKDGNRPPMRDGGGRPPMMGGGQPPMMGGGGQPPMRDSSSNSEKMKEDMKKRAEKKMKKMRKILTSEQYDLWLTMKSEQPALHPMPGSRRPESGEDEPPVDMSQNEAE